MCLPNSVPDEIQPDRVKLRPVQLTFLMKFRIRRGSVVQNVQYLQFRLLSPQYFLVAVELVDQVVLELVRAHTVGMPSQPVRFWVVPVYLLPDFCHFISPRLLRFVSLGLPRPRFSIEWAINPRRWCCCRPDEAERRQRRRSLRRQPIAELAAVEVPLFKPLHADPLAEPPILGPVLRHVATVEK